MWVAWAKSPTRIYTRPPSTTVFDFDATTIHPPPTPIHNHSISFNDIQTLLNHHHHHHHSLPPLNHSPSSSFHHHHRTASFKDIQTLVSENPVPKPSIFHRVRAWAHRQAQAQVQPPPDAQNRVVVYYTSLRVVRKTFDDCRAVRSILKGYRVKIDERDLSMDGSFVDELERIIGKKAKLISLPKVFVNGEYLGGAEEIRRLHEAGNLKRVIQGLPLAEVGICGVCGGYRFVVCQRCDGRKRVYIEDIGFKRCSRCNESGLIKCPHCTSVVF